MPNLLSVAARFIARWWSLPDAVRSLECRTANWIETNIAVLAAENRSIANQNLGIQKSRILEKYGCPTIKTETPVAYESPDHIQPWGTANDNHRNKRFASKLVTLLRPDRVSVMDLGCSGGGQIRDFIEEGYFAIGVEGSDYSLRRLRAEWLTIPEFLFTADITKPFRILNTRSGEVLKFTSITMWEVIEHIHEDHLQHVMSNIDAHLAEGGIVVMSIAPFSDVINGVELHQTVKPREWWLETLKGLGWTNNDGIIKYFDGDFIRNDEDAPGSFYVALTRLNERPLTSEKVRYSI